MEPGVLDRLRRVTRRQTTRVTHYGRKTGKPHEVTIWFVLDGEWFYIGTANVNCQWVRIVVTFVGADEYIELSILPSVEPVSLLPSTGKLNSRSFPRAVSEVAL